MDIVFEIYLGRICSGIYGFDVFFLVLFKLNGVEFLRCGLFFYCRYRFIFRNYVVRERFFFYLLGLGGF